MKPRYTVTRGSDDNLYYIRNLVGNQMQGPYRSEDMAHMVVVDGGGVVVDENDHNVIIGGTDDEPKAQPNEE